jgi:hypothetical protein
MKDCGFNSNVDYIPSLGFGGDLFAIKIWFPKRLSNGPRRGGRDRDRPGGPAALEIPTTLEIEDEFSRRGTGGTLRILGPSRNGDGAAANDDDEGNTEEGASNDGAGKNDEAEPDAGLRRSSRKRKRS